MPLGGSFRTMFVTLCGVFKTHKQKINKLETEKKIIEVSKLQMKTIGVIDLTT